MDSKRFPNHKCSSQGHVPNPAMPSTCFFCTERIKGVQRPMRIKSCGCGKFHSLKNFSREHARTQEAVQLATFTPPEYQPFGRTEDIETFSSLGIESLSTDDESIELREGILQLVLRSASAKTCSKFALSMCKQGNFASAERLYQRAWALHETSSISTPKDKIDLLLELGKVKHTLGRYMEAEDTYKTCIEVCNATANKNLDKLKLQAWHNLSMLWSTRAASEKDPKLAAIASQIIHKVHQQSMNI